MIFSSAPNDFLNLKYSDELYHHGIKGQKWGIRRYQNPDGSLTPDGILRYRNALNTAKGFTSKGKARNARDNIQIELIDEFYKRNPKPSRKEVQEGMQQIENLTNRMMKEHNPDGTLTTKGKERYSKTYTHTPWEKWLNQMECEFEDSKGTIYSARIENLDEGNEKDLKKVQKTLSDIFDDQFVNNIKKQLSDYISDSYEPENFGLNQDKKTFKTYLYNNISIEGISSSANVNNNGYDYCDFGVDFSFDDVPFMNDNDGVLDLTNKKIRDIGYPYPD